MEIERKVMHNVDKLSKIIAVISITNYEHKLSTRT